MAKSKDKKKKLHGSKEDEEESTMKAIKREKEKMLTMRMETISENPNKISPIVGYFPSGYNPLRNNTSINNGEEVESPEVNTKLYRNVKRNSRLQLVVSPNGTLVDFVGTNYSGEATSAQLCTYSLGVLDKDTQTLKIVPITANKSSSELVAQLDNVVTFDNGSNNPPTTFNFGPMYLASCLYQLSPIQDLALANTLVRPVYLYNLDDISNEMVLTSEKYGSVRRVFVVAAEDNALTKEFQQSMIQRNPPDEVEEISGPYHMP